MLLPETWTAAVILLFVAVACFAIWPNLFKAVGPKWRFELFSLDFALGTVLISILAAYTLGTRGSELDFSDSMLVAGRRLQIVAVGTGIVFAMANMFYLGSIALIGLSNASLLTFGVFGFGVAFLQVVVRHSVSPALGAVIFAAAVAFAYTSLKASRPAIAPKKNPGRPNLNVTTAMSSTTKGFITSLLAGVSFFALYFPLAIIQPDEFGIGAYGALLMIAIGIVIGTVLLNFFFMNISLEGGSLGYANYLTGTPRSHAFGVGSGAVWTMGALALYAARTGTAGVNSAYIWTVPFAGALVAVLTGVLLWQKFPLPAKAKTTKWAGIGLFVTASAVLLTAISRTPAN